jgi:hypothetical protein
MPYTRLPESPIASKGTNYAWESTIVVALAPVKASFLEGKLTL